LEATWDDVQPGTIVRPDGAEGEVMSVTKSRYLRGYRLRVEITQTNGKLAILNVEASDAVWVAVSDPER
jgi:hypothetical protein